MDLLSTNQITVLTVVNSIERLIERQVINICIDFYLKLGWGWMTGSVSPIIPCSSRVRTPSGSIRAFKRSSTDGLQVEHDHNIIKIYVLTVEVMKNVKQNLKHLLQVLLPKLYFATYFSVFQQNYDLHSFSKPLCQSTNLQKLA